MNGNINSITCQMPTVPCPTYGYPPMLPTGVGNMQLPMYNRIIYPYATAYPAQQAGYSISSIPVHSNTYNDFTFPTQQAYPRGSQEWPVCMPRGTNLHSGYTQSALPPYQSALAPSGPAVPVTSCWTAQSAQILERKPLISLLDSHIEQTPMHENFRYEHTMSTVSPSLCSSTSRASSPSLLISEESWSKQDNIDSKLMDDSFPAIQDNKLSQFQDTKSMDPNEFQEEVNAIIRTAKEEQKRNLILQKAKRKDVKKNEESMEAVKNESHRNDFVITIVEDSIPKSDRILTNTHKKDQRNRFDEEDKRLYDRAFLLQMQSQPLSLKKPDGLPNLEIIKDTSNGREICPYEIKQQKELYKKVQKIFNTYQILEQQVKSLTLLINTEEKMEGVIDLIFEKVRDEPNFSNAYANLCKNLASNKENDCVNFHKILLNKCLKELEKNVMENRLKSFLGISSFKSKDEEDKLLKEHRKTESKTKRRSLGTIRFIEELFKLDILSVDDIYECLTKLPSEADEDLLECLRQLLMTTGRDMESDKSKRNTKDNNLISRRQNNNSTAINHSHDKTELEAFKAAEALLQPQSMQCRFDEQAKKKISCIVKQTLLGSSDTSENEMKKRTESIIDEFLHNNDLQGAAFKVSALCSYSTIHLFITNALILGMKYPSQARCLIGHLTDYLVKEKIILIEQYIKGLESISAIAEDSVFVKPGFWKYLAELIVPVIQNRTLPLSCVLHISQPCTETGLVGKLALEVLYLLTNIMGIEKFSELWRNSNLSWFDFLLANQNQEQSITENISDFTIAERKSLLQPQLSFEEVKQHLSDMLQKNKSDNEEIFDWIDRHVTDAQIRNFVFIRSLMTTVIQSVLESTGTTWKLQEEALRKRCTLLLKYLDYKVEFELQALYALQALIHQMEQPKSILSQIFETLYEEDVISEEAFLQWESSDDPAEQKGKDAALSSAQTFYTCHREIDNESSEEN